ncbi:uncharacterized protein O3C94_020150 [Discoglossus pictus]
MGFEYISSIIATMMLQGVSFNWLSILLSLAVSLHCVSGIKVKCPSPCDCIAAPNISVICTSSQLATFPDLFPSSTVSISVEFTSITSLPPESLSAVPRIEELHLSNNVLDSLPDRLLTPLNNLHTLDLTNNNLKYVNYTFFLDMPNLNHLILSGNHLTELWSSDTRLLWKLKRLDVSRNHLTALQQSTFSHFMVMKSLDISYNDICELSSSLLRNMIMLERLNLEGNKLSSLPPRFFTNSYFMQHIFLARNTLRSLPAGLLRSLTLLRTLDLSENLLHTLPLGLLPGTWKVTLRGEQVLDLSNNPWHCDCHLLPMHSWVTEHKDLMYSMSSTQCAGPEVLKGITLVQVQEDDLHWSCPEAQKLKRKTPSKSNPPNGIKGKQKKNRVF